MPDNHEEEAAKLGFDLTKQFITIAIGGVAFVVGLSQSSPTAISFVMLVATVGVFGFSAVFGLIFLMRGVNRLSVEKSYDVYSTSLRILAALQITFVLIGVVLLCPTLFYRSPLNTTGPSANTIQVQLAPQQTLTFPVEADKNYTIELENGKVNFAATKQ